MLSAPPPSSTPQVVTTKVSSSYGAAAPVPGSVFRMVQASDGRSTGSMPVWGKPQTPQDTIAGTLASATSRVSPETNLALSLSQDASVPAEPEESFGFFDIIDMVNPLQHIPVVGTLYRTMSGDTIKPVAQIVGGGLFGGAIGAVGGIVNAMVQTQTGKDVGGNALAMFMGEPQTEARTIRDSTDTTLAMTALAYRAPRYNE